MYTALMLPKLENKTQTRTIVYIVLLIINCSTYMYIIHTVYNKIKHMIDWILRANRARAVPLFGMVQNMYRTRTVQYQRIYFCILFWKIMLNRRLILILRPICGLLKKIKNHNRSKFVLSKLVLTGVCCKHFMYPCMHRSCTVSCVHVECMSTHFVIRLLFNVQNSDNIFLKYECQIFVFP